VYKTKKPSEIDSVRIFNNLAKNYITDDVIKIRFSTDANPNIIQD